MSKKNLSKTIIEGGRTKSSKYDRRESLRTTRTTVRCKLRSCSDYDELELPKRMQFSDTWFDEKFDDKLGPLKRWIGSQVGRSWDSIYSEIKEKFDTRTTPGRHVVYDHLFHYVDVKGLESRKYADYYVDSAGILRENESSWRHTRARHRAIWRERDQAFAWLNRRKIGQVGQYYYWFEATRPFDGSISYDPSSGGYSYMERSSWYWTTYRPVPVSFRQTRLLNDAELKYFRSLKPENQKTILNMSPLNKKKNR